MKVRGLKTWVEILPMRRTGREKDEIFLFLSTKKQIKLNEITEKSPRTQPLGVGHHIKYHVVKGEILHI